MNANKLHDCCDESAVGQRSAGRIPEGYAAPVVSPTSLGFWNASVLDKMRRKQFMQIVESRSGWNSCLDSYAYSREYVRGSI